uniref:Uncharacterized protein n=1 Tax=viral metagenome TaxID=1070528 RepID=A0A6M3KCH6_9ZZZZ
MTRTMNYITVCDLIRMLKMLKPTERIASREMTLRIFDEANKPQGSIALSHQLEYELIQRKIEDLK